MSSRGSERGLRDSDSGSNREGLRIKCTKNKHTLNPEGYLYTSKIDTNNILDPNDLGLTILQARRKGRMEKFHSPEKYFTQVQNITNMTRTKQQDRNNSDKEMWGDNITTNGRWPKINQQGHIRLLFYNVNGISYKNDYFEMDMLMQLGGQLQVDVMMITEVNLNLHQAAVRAKLKDSIRQY